MTRKGSIQVFITVLAVALLGLCRPSAAQSVTVQASVDENTIGVEDRVFYTIEITGASPSDIETPDPPVTQNLALMQSTPSTQRSMSITNGQVSQSVAFRWMFRPLRQGSARLGPAEVQIEGRTYRTEAIEMSILAQSQRPPRSRSRSNWPFPVDPNDRAAEEEPDALNAQDLFIRAVPSTTRAYQNEQITVEYQLYFRQGIQLGQSRLADSWDAEGFWREDLDVEPRPIPRVIVENGLRYNMIVLKRVAVFPTRSGTLQIDPLRIESEVYLPFGSGDPFARFFSGGRSRFEPVELSSPAIMIETQPLPPDAPPGFGGAVGTFRLNTRVNRTTLEVGEPIEVQVTISGTGNLATLEPPRLRPPGVFEQYDPQIQTSITRSGERIHGSKEVTYILVPRSNGTFTLPPLALTYLDPETGHYETLRSEPATLHVTGAPEAPAATSTNALGLPVDDIAGILLHAADWRRAERTPLHLSVWPYVALLLPLVVLGSVFAYHRHVTRIATDHEYARNRMAHPIARKHLKQAQALLEQDKPPLFYAELERAVLGFIGNCLNISERGLTRQRLDTYLAAAGASETIRAELTTLLDTCDRARFSPVLPDRPAMEADRDLAGRLIVTLDEHFNGTDVPSTKRST